MCSRQTEVCFVASMRSQEGISFFSFQHGCEADHGNGGVAVGGGPYAAKMDAVLIVAALVIFDPGARAGGSSNAFHKADYIGRYSVIIAGQRIQRISIRAYDHQGAVLVL